MKSNLKKKEEVNCIGSITAHISMQHMDSLMQKMRRRKETSVHILGEYLALERIKIPTWHSAQTDPNQKKEARLGVVAALTKGVGLLNNFL